MNWSATPNNIACCVKNIRWASASSNAKSVFSPRYIPPDPDPHRPPRLDFHQQGPQPQQQTVPLGTKEPNIVTQGHPQRRGGRGKTFGGRATDSGAGVPGGAGGGARVVDGGGVVASRGGRERRTAFFYIKRRVDGRFYVDPSADGADGGGGGESLAIEEAVEIVSSGQFTALGLRIVLTAMI